MILWVHVTYFRHLNQMPRIKCQILSYSAYLTTRKGHYLQRYQAGETQAGRHAGRHASSDPSLGSTLSLTHSRWPLLWTIKLKKSSLMGITVCKCLILNRDISKGSLSLSLQKTNWMPLQLGDSIPEPPWNTGLWPGHRQYLERTYLLRSPSPSSQHLEI